MGGKNSLYSVKSGEVPIKLSTATKKLNAIREAEGGRRVRDGRLGLSSVRRTNTDKRRGISKHNV